MFVLFQSTLPSRGATIRSAHKTIYRLISIHAPLAGSNVFYNNDWDYATRISIHAPLAGSNLCGLRAWTGLFHFNPRSPRGEQQYPAKKRRDAQTISIHAPLAGSNLYTRTAEILRHVFQSTLPSRGATRAA